MISATKPVKIGSLQIGDGNFALIAGPCSVESEEQFETVARAVKASGATFLRGGMFKLRTRPDTFQGLGREAFDIAKRVKAKVSMPFVSEVTDPREISDMMDIVDVFQVGSRNMHNYALLKELGKVDKPVLLKRGFSGLIKEWLHSADYIVSGGNDQVILCERGIRTFETATRNTFDLNAVAFVKQNSSFPVIADPSHGTGESSLVIPLALASAAAGADGLMIEVHPKPSEALSDGFQALNLQQFEQMALRLEKVLQALDRKLVVTP
jgi:3-deoxy-7-phosphoheptulonate synthase